MIGSSIMLHCSQPGARCDTRGGVLVTTETAWKRMAGGVYISAPRHALT